MFCYPKSGYERIHWRIHVHSDFRLQLPRIGQNRELKKIIEGYWKGANDLAAVKATAAELRAKHWKLQQAAGIDLIPATTSSYYDQMLDTAIPSQRDSAALRTSLLRQPGGHALRHGPRLPGRQRGDVTALPMKKWFTTNYHYLVPEVRSAAEIKLNSTKPFDGVPARPRRWASTPKPVFIGPYTFLKLAHYPEATELELDKGPGQRRGRRLRRSARQVQRARRRMGQLDEAVPRARQGEPGDVELFKTLYTKIPVRQRAMSRCCSAPTSATSPTCTRPSTCSASTASAWTSTKVARRTSKPSPSTAWPPTPPSSPA